MAAGAGMVVRPDTVADRIVFVGHATVLIECDGVRLLTDPLLRARVAHLRRRVPPPDTSVAEDLDGVLISHLHYDHLDLPSLRRLGGETPLFVPAGAGAWLRRRGFTRVSELAVGEEASMGGLTLAAVPARHEARRVGVVRAPAIGFLVRGRSAERAIYFAGDTAFFPEMSDLSGQLDVALLPIAGWGETLGPGHMDPLDAARAASLLAPRLAIPIHWGTLTPIGGSRRHRERLAEPPRLFARHLARLSPQIEVRVLTPGQQTLL